MQMASCNGGPDQSKPHLRAEVNMGICSGFLGQVSGSRNGNRNLRLRVPANCNSRGSSAYVGANHTPNVVTRHHGSGSLSEGPT